jgi:hypothetical protein
MHSNTLEIKWSISIHWKSLTRKQDWVRVLGSNLPGNIGFYCPSKDSLSCLGKGQISQQVRSFKVKCFFHNSFFHLHVQWDNSNHFFFITDAGSLHPNGDQFKWHFFTPNGGHFKFLFFGPPMGGRFKWLFIHH